METFCTIVTSGYVPFAQALFDAVRSFDPGMKMQVLVVDEEANAVSEPLHPNISIHTPHDLSKVPLAAEMRAKYYDGAHPDRYRWGMKPVFMRHLLNEGYSRVIYVDPDLFFFSDYRFLFDELKSSAILLTPHWRTLDFRKDPKNFVLNFSEGLYNAGFVGAGEGAEEALKWWAEACLFECSRDGYPGIHDDQAYLNLLPVYFEGTRILQHRGCNVAAWNKDECSRDKIDGQVLINKKYPVVFIHFTRSTIRGIYLKRDKWLKPCLDRYLQTLGKYGIRQERLVPKKKGFIRKLFT